jgi:hypothetical protein
VGLTYPLFTLATGRMIMGTLRYTGMYMPSVDVMGRAPLSGFDYRARVDSGWQHSIQAGVIF